MSFEFDVVVVVVAVSALVVIFVSFATRVMSLLVALSCNSHGHTILAS